MCVVVLFFACNSSPKLPFYTEASFTPNWEETENIHTIPTFSFKNQYGEVVTEETFKNRIYIADFVFTTCPGICPKMTTNMQRVQEAFKADSRVMFLSHSVTPEIDSIPVLYQYAMANKAIKDKWHIVTGKKKEIYSIARNAYFADEDMGNLSDETRFLHTENFLLIDQKRRIRGVYNGTLPADIQRLIGDVKRLQKEFAI